MKVTIDYNDSKYQADLSKPLDISIPYGQVRCFYAPKVVMQPFTDGSFIGSVKKGAPVNFYDVQLNPHGNGTHTECLGHITRKQESVNQQLKTFHHVAQLVTVTPVSRGKSDRVITVSLIKKAITKPLPPTIVIRTTPNSRAKLTKDYSGTNPPYLDKRAMQFLVDSGVEHLLIDLPSVDREVDKGRLAAHHVFWKVGEGYSKKESRKKATITELVFIDNKIKDGHYLLNLQIAPLELDASPSKPVLYRMKSIK